MEHWNVFDSRCTVGRHVRMTEGGRSTAAELLDDMDHQGIAEALVVDSLSRECHPADGNPRVIETCATNPRLHPAWAALPPGTPDEQPAPEELLQQMREQRVGALFLFTGQHRLKLTDWCVDELLEPMAHAGVPVFIVPDDIGPFDPPSWDVTDWPAVVDLCRRHPRLPVIVSERRIRQSQRLIYRALDACDNLHIELSGYWLRRGVEYITRRWGARRLIFGSQWPQFGQAMTLAELTAAEIDDEDKLRVAGDNLRELIRWCEPQHPAVELPPPADEFVRFARTGERPAEMTFHDCHGHLGLLNHYHIPDGTIDGAVAEMDRLGVERTLVFSFPGVVSDEVFGNDVVAAAVKRYPDRFIGFTLLNPHRGRQAMLDELQRGAALGLRGIKLIPHYQCYPGEGPLIDVACQWAHDHRQIILNHNWGSPGQVKRLVSTYPDACFIAGHTTLEHADTMKEHGNFYVCSCPLIGPRDCEATVAAIGADRLLFGSDLLDLPIAWGLGPILFARISPEDKRLILGENLKRILRDYSLCAD